MNKALRNVPSEMCPPKCVLPKLSTCEDGITNEYQDMIVVEIGDGESVGRSSERSIPHVVSHSLAKVANAHTVVGEQRHAFPHQRRVAAEGAKKYGFQYNYLLQLHKCTLP